MTTQLALNKVLEGWDGYQTSIAKAIAPLNSEQLAWRPAAQLRSVGELARHIALGRIVWFARLDAPGSRDLTALIPGWEKDPHGNRYAQEDSVDIAGDAPALVHWLEQSWDMVAQTLAAWSVDDLAISFRHTWRSSVYAVPRQWVVWRIMAHDIHHGGELSLMLGQQGIECFELGGLGGHIIDPPLAEG